MTPGRQPAIYSDANDRGGDAEYQRHALVTRYQSNFLPAVEKGAESRLHVARDVRHLLRPQSAALDYLGRAQLRLINRAGRIDLDAGVDLADSWQPLHQQ